MTLEDEVLFKRYNITGYTDWVCDNKTSSGRDDNPIREEGQPDTTGQHGVNTEGKNS